MSLQIPFSHILGIALLAAVGCQKPAMTPDANASAAAIEPVEVVQVRGTDLSLDVTLPTTVEGYEQAELMSKIDGYVESVDVNIGDLVTQGDILAMLRVPELDNEVDRKREMVKQVDSDIVRLQAHVHLAEAEGEEQTAALQIRKTELARFESLVSKGALNERRRDEAKFAVAAAAAAVHRCEAAVEAAEASVHAAIAKRGVATAEMKHAETMARYREIRAPFDGLITARKVDSGDFVRPATSDHATALFAMTRVDHVRLVFFMPMERGRQLDAGDRVVIHDIQTMPGVTVREIDGQPLTVTRISNVFDAASRMMRAEVDIDNGHFEKQFGVDLKPGDYGKVTLQLHNHANVPTVPTTAIGTNRNGKKYVIRIDDSNTCYEVPIQILIEKGDLVGIASADVATGDKVIAKGIDRVEHKQTLSSNEIQQADAKPSP